MDDLDAPIVVTESSEEQPTEGVHVTNKDQTASLHSFFNIVNPTNKETEMLLAIQDYFKGDSDVDTIVGLRNLENRLGSPKLGETRMSRIFQYIKAQNSVNEAEKLRDSLLR